MNYYKTKSAIEYTNTSRSTIRRLLLNTLNIYSLLVDSPIDTITSRTDDIRKVQRGKTYDWEYSQELLDTIKTYPSPIETELVNIPEEEVEPVREEVEQVVEEVVDIPEEEPEEIEQVKETPMLTSVLLDQIKSQNKIINDLNERLKESNYNTNVLTKQLTGGNNEH